MLPPAPGRLSTTTGWPHASVSFCATARARMSVVPPGGKRHDEARPACVGYGLRVRAGARRSRWRRRRAAARRSARRSGARRCAREAVRSWILRAGRASAGRAWSAHARVRRGNASRSIDLRARRLHDARVLRELGADEFARTAPASSAPAPRPARPAARACRAQSRILVDVGVPFARSRRAACRPARAGRTTSRCRSRAGPPPPSSAARARASSARAVVTASARSLPALTCGIALARLSNMNCVSPASSACVAGAPPLNGTCTMSMPVSTLNSSPARWPALPLLPEPNDSLPGFAFA